MNVCLSEGYPEIVVGDSVENGMGPMHEALQTDLATGPSTTKPSSMLSRSGASSAMLYDVSRSGRMYVSVVPKVSLVRLGVFWIHGSRLTRTKYFRGVLAAVPARSGAFT